MHFKDRSWTKKWPLIQSARWFQARTRQQIPKKTRSVNLKCILRGLNRKKTASRCQNTRHRPVRNKENGTRFKFSKPLRKLYLFSTKDWRIRSGTKGEIYAIIVPMSYKPDTSSLNGAFKTLKTGWAAQKQRQTFKALPHTTIKEGSARNLQDAFLSYGIKYEKENRQRIHSTDCFSQGIDNWVLKNLHTRKREIQRYQNTKTLQKIKIHIRPI